MVLSSNWLRNLASQARNVRFESDQDHYARIRQWLGEEIFNLTIGVRSSVRALICIDLYWLVSVKNDYAFKTE